MAEAAERLCRAADLAESGRAFVFEVVERGRPARAFVLRHEGAVVGYLNRCAHVPAEMDWQEGEFLDADRRFIVCSIHGASYRPADGRCVGGPCGRGRLVPLTVREEGGEVLWYPDSTIRPPAFDEPVQGSEG